MAEIPADQRQDPTFLRTHQEQYGRDGCRVPLPWTREGSSFGFGAGGAHLPQPSWFADASVQAEEGDPASTLSLYRRALALRHELLAPERLEWVETGRGDVLRFRRPNGWEVVTVFGSAPLGRVAGGGGCRTARDRRRHAGVGEGCRGVSPGIPRCSGGDGASDPIDAFNWSVASTENDKLSR